MKPQVVQNRFYLKKGILERIPAVRVRGGVHHGQVTGLLQSFHLDYDKCECFISSLRGGKKDVFECWHRMSNTCSSSGSNNKD